MSNPCLALTLWSLAFVALWVVFARDPLTIVLCAVFTIPHTIRLLRESRRQQTRRIRA